LMYASRAKKIRNRSIVNTDTVGDSGIHQASCLVVQNVPSVVNGAFGCWRVPVTSEQPMRTAAAEVLSRDLLLTGVIGHRKPETTAS
jgi:hypothetical protein